MILTVTRECNLRCSYCPTAKDGWPSLSNDDALRALDLFASRWVAPEGRGGVVKLFGGEPLLVPDVVRAVIERAQRMDRIASIQLSTNGLGLDDGWLDFLRAHDKAILQVSMDGTADVHRRHRRSLPTVGDTYDHLVSLAPRLARMPRVVVTQTIAPAVADRAAESFDHLLALGFTRFNFLPGYYIPWSEPQLASLERAFDAIAERVLSLWSRNVPVHVRNLTTLAPTPFFNSGLIVDADRTIHPSNVGLSGALEELLHQTRIGDLDHPPTPAELDARSLEVNALLARALSPRILESTQAADAALTRFCKKLYPRFFAHRVLGARPGARRAIA